MALASKADFEERHGATDERVEPLLDDASSLILTEVESSEAEWVTEEEPKSVPAIVTAICVEVAYRAWSNPDALSSESLGAYTQAWQNRSGSVFYLTKAEKRMLRRAADVSSVRSVILETPYTEPGEINSISDNDLL